MNVMPSWCCYWCSVRLRTGCGGKVTDLKEPASTSLGWTKKNDVARRENPFLVKCSFVRHRRSFSTTGTGTSYYQCLPLPKCLTIVNTVCVSPHPYCSRHEPVISPK